MGAPHPELGDEVVAVIVPAAGMTIDETNLRERAREVLSAYKVPRRFFLLASDEVPRFATGKADKRTMTALVVDSS